MNKFMKKPVIVEAVQITSDMVLDHALPTGVILCSSYTHPEDRTVSDFRGKIKTLEGDMECRIGDWIITGVKGEQYPCNPDIFAMTYEPVTAQAEGGES